MSTMGGNSQSYTFDVYGNVVSVTTNASSVNTPTLSGSNHLAMGTYDAAGNLITWMGTSYEYDAFNQLKRRHRAGAEDWRYVYTADDERFWSYRVGGGGSIWALRGLDGQVLRRYDAHVSWGTYEDYVYRDGQLLAAAHTPVAPAPKTGMWHFHLDHLGTPRMVTNANGGSIGFHRYYPFGQEETALQEGETRKFTGHERDLASLAGTADGLDYMHARHHSPLTGRFLSADPIEGSPWLPLSWNRYAYVLDNPIKYADPFGLQWDDPLPRFDDTICVTSSGGPCRKPTANSPQQMLTPNEAAGFLDFLLFSAALHFYTTADTTARTLQQTSAVLAALDQPRYYCDESGCHEMKIGVMPFGPGGLRFTFGHGFRHLVGTGLSREAVEAAIKANATSQAKLASQTGSFWGRITINGRIVEYRAYTLPDGSIHVGTYIPY